MRLRFWLTAVLAVILGVAGVQGIAQATGSSGGTDRINTERSGHQGNYEPVEYFKGIYFGVGPVADEVPQLHPDRSPEEQREMERLAKEVRGYIESEDPRHFDELAHAIRSGDHVETRKALMATGEMVGGAYLELYPGQLPPGYCEGGSCEREMAKEADAGVFMVKQVAIAIQVWRYLWLWDDENAALPPWPGDPDLYIDEITHLVVRQLAHTH